jgi:hypothetical protein
MSYSAYQIGPIGSYWFQLCFCSLELLTSHPDGTFAGSHGSWLSISAPSNAFPGRPHVGRARWLYR